MSLRRPYGRPPRPYEALLRNLDPSEARVICDRQASQRLMSVMSSGEIVSVVLVGSEDDRARLARLLPERVRAKVAARLDPPHPWLSREALTGLVSQAIQSLPQPVAKG